MTQRSRARLLSVLVSVLLALRCQRCLQAPTTSTRTILVDGLEGGTALLVCPGGAAEVEEIKEVSLVKELRDQQRQQRQLVYERHGRFPASFGAGYFDRVSVATRTQPLAFNLSRLNQQDEGEYACRVITQGGSVSVVRISLRLWLPPRFVDAVGPSPVVVARRVGDYAVLRCPQFAGRPDPTASWLLNDCPLSNRDRHRIDPGLPAQLHVYNLNADDSGRYSCRIQNPYGISEFDYILIVGGRPAAFIHRPPPELAMVQEADRLELPCGFYAAPELRAAVAWERLAAEDSAQRWLPTLPQEATVWPNGSLVLSPTLRGHSGVFRCLITSTAGPAPVAPPFLSLTGPPVRVTVRHPPTPLSNASLAQFLPLGLPGSVVCPVSADPPVTETDWRRDGAPIGAALSGRQYRFNRVTPSHSGRYRCRALGGGAFNWSPWTPEFQVFAVEPPRLESRPLPLYQLTPGASARLPCAFRSPPGVPADPVWLRDGRRIDYRDRRLAYDPLARVLTVRDAQPDLAGWYSCELDNPVIPLAVTTRLLVELAPHRPPSNLTVTGATPYSISLKWHPAYDSGRHIRYAVWHRRHGTRGGSGGGSWHRQLAEPPFATDAVVLGLVADAAYELRVTASSGDADDESNAMHVKGAPLVARTLGYSAEAVWMPLPRDSAGRPVYPPIERNLGPPPGPPSSPAFAIVGPTEEDGREDAGSGVLRVSWKQPPNSPVPVLYYFVEVGVGDGAAEDNDDWEALTRVQGESVSLSVRELPVLRRRVAEAATTRRLLRVSVTACGLLSQSSRVQAAALGGRLLQRLLPPAAAAAAAAAAAFYGGVPARAAWVLLSGLLSFLVLVGAILGMMSRRRGHDGGGADEDERKIMGARCEPPPPHPPPPRFRPRRHRQRRQRHRQFQHSAMRSPGVFVVDSGGGGCCSHRPDCLAMYERRFSDPESGFHSLGADSAAAAATAAAADEDDDDELGISDIEATLQGGGCVHGWSKRVPISVYLDSYRRVRRLRRAAAAAVAGVRHFRESELL